MCWVFGNRINRNRQYERTKSCETEIWPGARKAMMEVSLDGSPSSSMAHSFVKKQLDNPKIHPPKGFGPQEIRRPFFRGAAQLRTQDTACFSAVLCPEAAGCRSGITVCALGAPERAQFNTPTPFASDPVPPKIHQFPTLPPGQRKSEKLFPRPPKDMKIGG